MSIKQYLGKIWILLKTITNPSFFIYRIFHYLNKDVPYGIARCIYRKNLVEYNKDQIEEFLLDTYDGSGQVVHPDMAYFDNQYWLTVTPYPYGMEEYENPCIYHGENFLSLKCPIGPIAVQHKHTQGVHLSDPCFAVKGRNLFCYYRESERKGNIERNTIYGLQYSNTEKKWGAPSLLLHSEDDKILSPAMIFDDEGELSIYYVSTLNNKYTLVSTRSNGDKTDIIEYKIEGMPIEYDLWHIGISKLIDIKSETSNKRSLAGLFLMRSKKKGGGMKLYETYNNGADAVWHIVREIVMPYSINDIIAFPYKSCFIPRKNGAVLLSFRDKKSRNRMIVINN